MTESDIRYRPEIDGLRALAVVPVVLYHAGIPLFGGGFVGVDVFFVISGFLITSLIRQELDEGRFSLLAFWERRARRILPAFAVVAVFTLVVGWFLFLPGDYRNLGQSAFAQSVFASNIYFWLRTGYFGPAAEQMPLLHTWSLAVEEQFYLIFPLTMFALSRYVRPLRAASIALMCLAAFAINVVLTQRDPAAAFFLLPARAWELGLGALLALGFIPAVSSERRVIAEIASLLGIGLIVLASILFSAATPFPGFAALAPTMGAALVIWGTRGGRTFVGRFLSARPLVGTGLISYSLYLWHWPLIVFALYSSGRQSLPIHWVAGIIGVSFVLAYLSWRYVETPVRRRRIVPGRVPVMFASLAVLLAVGSFGFSTLTEQGFPDRLAPELIAYAYDQRTDRQQDCTYKDGEMPEVHKLSNLCAYGLQTDPPQFILWGDSHADALMPAMDLLSETMGASGVHAAYSNCPPIVGVTIEKRPYCDEFNDQILSVIEGSSIRSVVLAAAWGGYLVPSNALVPKKPTDADRGASLSDVATRYLAQTVAALRDEGYEVWLVEDNPWFNFDPPTKLANEYRFKGDPSLVGAARIDLTGPMAAEFGKLSAEGAHLIDLPSVLCDETFCPAARDGHTLYRDFQHLSTAGSRYVAPAFGDALR